MMKEEIIIAQECEFWQEGHCDMYYQSSEKYPHCMEYPNCYYKQLKRKEQECEILTQENQEAKEIIADLKNEREELKTHYEQQLKAMCDKYNTLLENTNKEGFVFMSEIGRLRNKLDIAKEALEVIKLHYIGDIVEECEQALKKIKDGKDE